MLGRSSSQNWPLCGPLQAAPTAASVPAGCSQWKMLETATVSGGRKVPTPWLWHKTPERLPEQNGTLGDRKCNGRPRAGVDGDSEGSGERSPISSRSGFSGSHVSPHAPSSLAR